MKRLSLAILLAFLATWASAQTLTPPSTSVGTCGVPVWAWTSVPGASQYELQKNGATICLTSGLSCSIYNYIEPGAAAQFRVRARVSDVWQPFGPALNQHFDCTQWSNRPVGTQNILAALFNFPDDLATPMSPAEADSVMATFATKIASDSYGLATVSASPTLGYFTMPQPITFYCSGPTWPSGVRFGCDDGVVDLKAHGRQILTDLGHNLANYQDVILFFPHVGGAWGGALGSTLLPDPVEWLKSVIAHEWGHTEGLLHSGDWKCGTGSETGVNLDDPTASGCNHNRYGDDGEPMGAPRDMGMGFGVLSKPYAAIHRASMGWIPSDERVVAECGTSTYALKALDGLVAPREIRIPINAYPGWFYSLEYRPDGVWIWLHIGAQGLWTDADIYRVNNKRPITLSDSFTDAYRGIVVTANQLSESQAVLTIQRANCICGV